MESIKNIPKINLSQAPLTYFNKFGFTTNGIEGETPPKRHPILYSLLSAFYSFIGLLVILVVEYHTDYFLVVASLGASTVLIFDSIKSPLAQPKNTFFGHIISAIIGVSYEKLFSLGDSKYYYKPIVGAFAISTSIFVMAQTNTLHPPGGATALIPIIGGPKFKALGYWYVLNPIATAISFLVGMAIVLNNLSSDRHYPSFWY